MCLFNKYLLLVINVSLSPHDVYSLVSFPDGSVVKESACNVDRRHWSHPWVGKMPWRRKWQPIIVFLSGEFHGQRRLEGYSQRFTKSQTQLSMHAETEEINKMTISIV